MQSFYDTHPAPGYVTFELTHLTSVAPDLPALTTSVLLHLPERQNWPELFSAIFSVLYVLMENVL